MVRRPSEISSAFHGAQGIPLIDADLPARWQAGIAKKGHFWMETILASRQTYDTGLEIDGRSAPVSGPPASDYIWPSQGPSSKDGP